MEHNTGTQDHDSKEEGQPKDDTLNDPVVSSKEPSEDSVRLIRTTAAEAGPQEWTIIKAKHSATMKRVN